MNYQPKLQKTQPTRKLIAKKRIKLSVSALLSIVLFGLLVVGGIAAVFLTGVNQDLRQQASGPVYADCSFAKHGTATCLSVDPASCTKCISGTSLQGNAAIDCKGQPCDKALTCTTGECQELACLCPAGCNFLGITKGRTCGGYKLGVTPPPVLLSCSSVCSNSVGCACSSSCGGGTVPFNGTCERSQTKLDDCKAKCQNPFGCVCPENCIRPNVPNDFSCGARIELNNCNDICNDNSSCTCPDNCVQKTAWPNFNCGGNEPERDLTNCDDACLTSQCTCPGDCVLKSAQRDQTCGGRTPTPIISKQI